MKRLILSALLAAILLTSCGSDVDLEEASPLSVVPDRAIVSIVVSDPAGMVKNIDGYIQNGAPVLGANVLENLICEQLGVLCLDSVTARYGVDPSGDIAFWMESAMPGSMGMAASAPDFPLFLSLMEEMGMEIVVEESPGDVKIYSMDSAKGTIFFAGVQGVALMAMSSGNLQTMINGLSAETQYQVVPTSLTIKLNLSMIGPMAAAQMPMARMMVAQGMAADTTMPAYLPGIMDVYLDGIESFLSQADFMELTLITGPEDFAVKKNISFISGSALGEMLVATDEPDMIRNIPRGNVATVRFQMPSEIAYQITKAFTDVFTTEVSDEILYFWSSLASNGAVAVYDDDFIHMIVAYEAADDLTIEEVAVLYADYLEMLTPFLEQSEEIANTFSIQDNGIVQIEGVDFYSMSMSILIDTTTTMNFDYWLTVHDNALLMETAPQPEILLGIVAGDYIPAELNGTGQIAGEMSLAGYFKLIMSASPNGMEIQDIGTDVIFNWDGGYSEGEIYGEMYMNGSDAVATGFALFGLISAIQ